MSSVLPNRTLFGAASVKSSDELRESVYRLLERSFYRAEKQRPGGGLAVYRSSMRMLRAMCGERWVQITVFPEETQLVETFLDSSGLAPGAPRGDVRNSLLGNVWTRAWTGVLLKLERKDFAAVCRVTGAGHLRAVMDAGKSAVLVHRHNLFTQLFWRWLEHEKLEPGVTLRQWTWGRGGNEVQDKKTSALEGARELHTALQTLRRGGLVNVLADGHQGGSHFLTLPFFNRERPFRRTFAELVVAANVPVIPVDLTMRAGGKILMEISSPMEDDSDRDNSQERVDRLVRAYAAHLERIWRSHPADIPWSQMRWHLKYPLVQSGLGA